MLRLVNLMQMLQMKMEFIRSLLVQKSLFVLIHILMMQNVCLLQGMEI